EVDDAVPAGILSRQEGRPRRGGVRRNGRFEHAVVGLAQKRAERAHRSVLNKRREHFPAHRVQCEDDDAFVGEERGHARGSWLSALGSWILHRGSHPRTLAPRREFAVELDWRTEENAKSQQPRAKSHSIELLPHRSLLQRKCY